MKYLLLALIVWTLVGCVTISDIDTSKAEQNCARQCTLAYSSCVSNSSVGTKTVMFYQCKEALKMCLQTCPAK